MGVFGAGAMLIPALDPGLEADISQAMEGLRQLSPEEAATNEDYWKTIRAAYDYPTEFINLENGYYSPTPRRVLRAFLDQTSAINRQTSFYMRRQQDANKERIRGLLADFAGIGPEECALTRNTTESLDILIHGMDLKAGDEVIVTIFDYGSMLEAFRQQARRTGIVIKELEIPIVPQSNEQLIRHFEAAMTERTKAMLVTHMINLNGQILPARELCEIGRNAGVAVIVDGAHSFAHLNFQVNELACEFFGTSLHKWTSAPLGNGMLFVDQNRIKEIWPLYGDDEKAPDDIRKFEHQGTRPPSNYLAIEEAIEFNREITLERKEARLRYLKNYWTERVKDLPKISMNSSLKKEHGCAIANVAVQGMKAKALADELLKEYNIFTVAINRGPLQGVRVTPGLYNTVEDCEALVRALSKITK